MVVVSLFDKTCNILKPWAINGYSCFAFDMQHSGVSEKGNITTIGRDLMNGLGVLPFSINDIAFIAAFPPCDHLAVSGARWFAGKGLRSLSDSIRLFAVAAEFCESTKAPYFIENPVSTIATYWRKPDFTFHPYQYTGYCKDDNYTKKTCLWTGNGFTLPQPFVDSSLPAPDDRIHRAPPSPERKNTRSATPVGFAEAVYQQNRWH